MCGGSDQAVVFNIYMYVCVIQEENAIPKTDPDVAGDFRLDSVDTLPPPPSLFFGRTIICSVVRSFVRLFIAYRRCICIHEYDGRAWIGNDSWSCVVCFDVVMSSRKCIYDNKKRDSVSMT